MCCQNCQLTSPATRGNGGAVGSARSAARALRLMRRHVSLADAPASALPALLEVSAPAAWPPAASQAGCCDGWSVPRDEPDVPCLPRRPDEPLRFTDPTPELRLTKPPPCAAAGAGSEPVLVIRPPIGLGGGTLMFDAAHNASTIVSSRMMRSSSVITSSAVASSCFMRSCVVGGRVCSYESAIDCTSRLNSSRFKWPLLSMSKRCMSWAAVCLYSSEMRPCCRLE
mmetsp:Transcript_17894/g.46282  ORF Transcript_17894/g.46282 Transcript_17894/m.46282 type:complete len:226 (-) Transcript_17894:531-1208(-)